LDPPIVGCPFAFFWHGGASEREILLALRHLIAAEISRDVNKVTTETRFPEGLNIH
jgi:hypothetical protein